MKCTSDEHGYYAVVRRWSDNPHDVEVVEYADTLQHANRLARSIPPSAQYRVEIMKYE